MATKNQNTDAAKAAESEVTKQAPELFEINELRRKNKIGNAIFSGVCAANGWRPGKQISEEEFAQAVAEFTGASMDGRPPTKERKVKK